VAERPRGYEEKKSWLTPTLLVAMFALLTGGLGGAVFTYWMNRKPPNEIAAVVTSTTTGADSTAKSLVPNLSLKIGERDIPAIHIHTIDITLGSGDYVPRVELAVAFSAKSAEVFGRSYSSPTALHSIDCTPLPTGVRCNLVPVDRQGAYRIQLATDSAEPPHLAIIGQDLRLLTGVASLVGDNPGGGEFQRFIGLALWLTVFLAVASVAVRLI
jgi:hypothetical protein